MDQTEKNSTHSLCFGFKTDLDHIYRIMNG